MKGGIYSNENCPICGQRLKHFETLGVYCPDHKEIRARKMQLRFDTITRRFQNYKEASRMLNGFRYKSDEKTFDARDYQTSRPLGFENLVEGFLHSKRHIKSVKKYQQRLRFAVDAWGNRNVKEIGTGDIDDLINDLRDQDKSDKYIKVIRDTMEMLWKWLIDREEIEHLPKFPKVKGIMNFRNVVTKQDQIRIFNKIKEMTSMSNPRIYMAVSILMTYPSVRPGELIQAKEKDFDADMQRLYLNSTKEGKRKHLPLIPEDVEMLLSLGKSLPEMFLFRHLKGYGSAKPGEGFGKGYLNSVWRKACNELGIDGVSIYSGTKHSTVIDMRNEQGLSKSDCKEATGHKSNKAFGRYYIVQDDKLRELYKGNRPDNAVITLPVSREVNNIQ
jgi:integrase